MTTTQPVDGNRLRIAWFLAGFYAAGAERQALELAARLPRDRFEVDVVTTVGRGQIPALARAGGIGVHSVGSRPAAADPLPVRTARRGLKTLGLLAHARARRYDVIDARLDPFDLIAALTRSVTRTSVVVTGRRTMHDLQRPQRVVGRHLETLANRRTDALVACSEAVAADVRRHERLDVRKLRVIRNGVELVAPPTAGERATRRRELGVPDDAVVIGCIARYDPIKGQDRIVEAFAALAAERRDVHLVLVGEGSTRRVLERQIDALGLGARIRLHGWAHDAKALHAAFNLVVHAASSEGLPNAVLEAAAAGRPIVATAAGGTGEIVSDGLTGLLVPVGDVAAMTRAMGRLIDDAPLAARLGSGAREHAERAFAMDRMVREFGDLYEELWRARQARRAALRRAPAYPRAPDSAR